MKVSCKKNVICKFSDFFSFICVFLMHLNRKNFEKKIQNLKVFKKKNPKMCSSCYNCAKNFSCTTPMTRQCNNSSGRLYDCQRFVHLIHHWRPETEYYSKCTCCEQTRCKKNDLLHTLCPVAGMRGRTMQQLLFPSSPATAETTCSAECTPPPGKSVTVVPITAAVCDSLHELHVPEDITVVRDEIAKRLLNQLNGSETASSTSSTQKRQLNNFKCDLTNWYASEMRQVTQRERVKRETLNTARESKTRKRKPQPLRRSTVPDRYSYHWSLNLPTASDEDEPELSVSSETDVAEEPAEDAEKVALEDIRNFLKEIKSKPDRPILFHSPFDRDMIWTWRNYDPLEDVPKSMQKKVKKPNKNEYSPWTMDIITNVIEGKPISDKQVKSNKELSNAVTELAHEFKMRKLHGGKHKTR